MIIVAGALRVDPGRRDVYLAGCAGVIAAARRAPGCIDFHLSADAIEPDRVNVFEQWETVAAVEAFRGAGPSDEQAGLILAARVVEYEVTATRAL